jgi:hypothetical protein
MMTAGLLLPIVAVRDAQIWGWRSMIRWLLVTAASLDAWIWGWRIMAGLLLVVVVVRDSWIRSSTMGLFTIALVGRPGGKTVVTQNPRMFAEKWEVDPARAVK